MKNCTIKSSFTQVIVCFAAMLALGSSAQTFRVLHTFAALQDNNINGANTNRDGAIPLGKLLLSGSTLYGTTFAGGAWGNGVVFALNTDGTGFTNLYNFSALAGATNGDGALPNGGLILSGKTLFGTTRTGGNSGNGTIFALSTTGTGFTNLHSFTAFLNSTNADGGEPPADNLILVGQTLYGTAFAGGALGNGTVFGVNTNGTGFKTLHSFAGGGEGANPNSGMTSFGNTLYGTTSTGGTTGMGTVFSVNSDGTGFTTLHAFKGVNDGAAIGARLMLLGDTLYGTAHDGGSSGNGTVFCLNTNGTGFKILHSFEGPTSPCVSGNSEGGYPSVGLISLGGTLYGLAGCGGNSAAGTAFGINLDGTSFTTLYHFGGTSGSRPYSALVLQNNILYGTTQQGGTSDSGTVFSLLTTPLLTAAPAGPNMLLMWLTNFTGFSVQSSDHFGPGANWSTMSLPGPPSIANGKYAITISNSISHAQQYYRLSQ